MAMGRRYPDHDVARLDQGQMGRHRRARQAIEDGGIRQGDRMHLLGELSSPTAGSGPDRGSRVRSRLAAGGKWIRTLSPARTGDGVEPALVPLLPKGVPPAGARFWLSIRAGGRRTTRPACLLYDRLGTFLSAATYERIRTRWCVTVRGAAPAPSLRPAACRRSGSGSGRIAALPGMTASRRPP